MVQLYETMLTRHTCMIVGPTGGGKSVVINTLAQAQTRYGQFTVLSCTVHIVIVQLDSLLKLHVNLAFYCSL